MTVLTSRKGADRDRGAQSGFTLVEVMAALGILAFGILAVGTMQTSSLTGTKTAQFVTEATTVAMDKVEDLMMLTYADADLTNGTHGPEYDATNRYRIDWTVNDDQPVESTKTISVTVQWQERGVVKTSSLTYIKMDVI
jgi:prepilin-type N-terminal cleavage/methylation domain-containing protein